MKLFSEIANDENSSSETLLECAKAFLKNHDAKTALQILEKENRVLNSEEYVYVKALCYIELGKENEALPLLQSIKQKEFIGFANYYSGMIFQRQGKFEQAYFCFEKASEQLNNINFSKEAVYESAVCAMEANWIEKGIEKAEKFISIAYEENQKIRAVNLLSDLYIENSNYEKCEKMLLPLSKKADMLGKVALFKLGILYGKKGELEKADDAWSLYCFRFKNYEDVDEAFFRRAEIWYVAKNWKKAVELFNSFKNDFPKSKFFEIALFYLTDALFKNNEINRSFLLAQEFLKRFPESIYKFQVKINCVDIYQEKEDYESALKLLKQIIKEFPEHIDYYNLRKIEKNLEKLILKD
ncbi:MAG: tetratricopeptide repeat protein [Treponema sp.]|nr:tetratricopeptide repeat protein [Treponema sp.]